MRRLVGVAAGLLLGVLLLLTLTFGAAFQEPADVSFANLSEPKTLDPAHMTGAIEGRIADAIFEGLTYRDPATLRPKPGVAEYWEVSPDGRTYVFHLRQTRWSDGTPISAHDFVWSWRRFLAPETGAEYAYLLHGVRYARAFHQGRELAASLRGEVSEAWRALQESHDEIPETSWRAFLAEHDVVSAMADADAAEVQAWLARSEPPAPEERARLAAAFLAEAERHDERAREADARLGVDAGFYARDDRTFIVELVSPLPYFLELTAFCPLFPVPRQAVQAEGRADDWFLPGTIVSNGPFLLEAWRVGDRIRLRRNPDYWGRENIRIETVDALPVENLVTALNLYFADQIDWLPDYPNDLADTLRGEPDHYSNPAFILYYYRLNTTLPPLDDPRVRLALGLAIDREAITRDVLRLGQLPAHHMVPPGLPGYASPASAFGHDPERARALLAEAGYPGGEGFPEIGILYNTLESHKQIAEVVADQWRRSLGIEVKPYNQEWQSYLATVRSGDYHVARAGWIGDYLDPNTFLDLWITNGGNNQTGFGDPLFDRLLRAAADPSRYVEAPFDEGLREPDRMAAAREEALAAKEASARLDALARLRMQLLREAEAVLVQEAFPVLPIYTYVVKGLVKPRLGGFHWRLRDEDGGDRPNLQDLHPVRGFFVREPDEAAS
jgi:oligopeptide transport system substrate-binding protein